MGRSSIFTYMNHECLIIYKVDLGKMYIDPMGMEEFMYPDLSIGNDPS